MTEAASPFLIVTTNYRVALRAPGQSTARAECINWAAINDFVSGRARKRNYPVGTVLAVTDWMDKTSRFLVKGGAKGPPELVKLSMNVRGLPENPRFAIPADEPIVSFDAFREKYPEFVEQ